MKRIQILQFYLVLCAWHLGGGTFTQAQINFTEVTGTPFIGVGEGAIAFADVDGDGDQDVLITGYDFNQGIAKLYLNDGNGNYTEVLGTPFEGVYSSSTAFADVDGDGDPDLLITGQNDSSQSIAKLYTNDGSGNFTEVIGTPFVGTYAGTVAFADVDSDGDQDVLITGYISSGPTAKLYTNDGNGNFTEEIGTPFYPAYFSSVAFADVDADGDLDVLITGSTFTGCFCRITKLYSNDGNGNFTEVVGTPFEGIDYSSVAFSDIDDDGDLDLLIAGRDNSSQSFVELYTNDGNGNFSVVSGTPFEGVRQCSLAFADVDGDGDNDVLITGMSNSFQGISTLYINDGSGNFAEEIGTPFDGVNYSAIAFSDVDSDGDPDLLITGYSSSAAIAKLYLNGPVVSTCDIAVTNVTTTNENCPDANDGTITVNATCGSCAGGVGDIRYSLDNIDFTNTTGVFTGLADGSYTVYVQDMNDGSCSDSDGTYTITTENASCDPVSNNALEFNAEEFDFAISENMPGLPGAFTVETYMLYEGPGVSGQSYPCIWQLQDADDVGSYPTSLWLSGSASGFMLEFWDGGVVSYVFVESSGCTWNHVAYVWDGAVGTSYFNGVAVATHSTQNNIFTGGTLRVGKDFYDYHFNGMLDEFRVSDIARYTADFTPPTGELPSDANTVAHYRFNEAAGAITAADASGNGVTLQLGATIASESDDPTFVSAGSLPAGCICDITITNVAITDEACPNANDGTITVTATCGSCAGGDTDIRYSIDNVDFNNTNGEFTGLADGTYTVYVRDVNDITCTDSDGPFTINTENINCDPVPGNNDCVDAQNLSVVEYPSASNSLGSLYGATNGGGAACISNADGGDVYYTFTAATENHYWVNVNPFGGADVAVEVTDACGGTVVLDGCADAGTGGDAESVFMQNLPAGTYTIRVFSGVSAPSQAAGNFLINVQSFPIAQVQDNPNSSLYACNQTGFQLEDFVGATPQTTPGVLDYEWLVAEVGGGTQTVYQRGESNYVARCEWLGMEYGNTYNVFVKVLYDIPGFGPTWGVYQGDYQTPNNPGSSDCTIATAFDVTPTELRPNCTPNNAQGNDYALCDFAIAYNVSESENFRWRFDGNGTPGDAEDIIYTRGIGNPSVRLSWVNGLVPGLTYNVAVEVQVAGQWSGYSTVLPLTLALPPNDVEIRSQFCGGTYAPNGYIMSQSVCDADLYQFRFTPTGGGAPSYRNSGNYVCFMSAANPALTPGDYDVQVKVTQNGVPGDWGPACTITIAGPQGLVNETPALRDMKLVGTATLFPNPNAGDEVRVQLDGLSDGNHDVNIVIYDIYGKMISNQGFGHEGTSLNRLVRFDGELSMGMYMLQIFVDGERFAAERLVVK